MWSLSLVRLKAFLKITSISKSWCPKTLVFLAMLLVTLLQVLSQEFLLLFWNSVSVCSSGWPKMTCLWARLAYNLRSFCLSLVSPEITVVLHLASSSSQYLNHNSRHSVIVKLFCAMWCVHACMCADAFTHVGVHRGQRATSGVWPCMLSTLPSKSESLTD